ncbi:caspase family protein [Tenacibaculum tangerinum]|uniref:Caspase family protein n=1 Tax=Tenacibaculum tangerinum TaxID=3038772 RepID=A0ABY8L3C2_9FLAO|nr:caspase family protein [Tenacibaculum tangerinum]WGH75769.1 caspase family protein [Tenacibaculum tangerinum]
MDRKSLVIGINNYSHFPDLDNCINDSIDIHHFLETNDFDSKLLENPNQSELIREIAEFKKSINENTISLIYFSGHGLQDEKYNYIVPSDSEIRINEDIKYNCILVDDLLIETSKKNLHILILDACRNNPFQDGKKGISFGLAKMDAPAGTLIAFSTSPNSASIERKSERNGIYTKHLIKNFNVPNIPVELAFKNTRNDVMSDTDEKQIPWEESSLFGENFSFITKEESISDVEKIINQWIENKTEINTLQLLPFLEEPLFSLIPLDILHLIQSLVQISFDKESKGIIPKTTDEGYLFEKIVDDHLPRFQKRIVLEYSESEFIDCTILNEISILNDINYGFNWIEEPEDSFPQMISNEIEYDGKIGILSCFLTIEDNEHYLKPIIIFKENPLTFINYSILTGKKAEEFLNCFFEKRKPYEKEIPDPTFGIGLSMDDLFEDN